MNEACFNSSIKINLPESVALILETIRTAGFEAYAVGGCVRDSILGKMPKDWDITTSAKPEKVKALFNRTVDTGIQHGTVTVMIKGEGYEVTTYRVDGEYTDGRHPKEVTFTASLEEDLKRRDFTINAMAYNEEQGVVDCFNGIEDLRDGVIRCVGDAKERFTEDALRMLRAVRFGGVLGFRVHPDTLRAIEEMRDSIVKISRERIQAELTKLILSDYPDRVMLLYETGLIKCIFDGAWRKISEEEYTLQGELLARQLMAAPKEHYVRWALFITFVSAGNILKSLKFDNSTIKICSKIYDFRDACLNAAGEENESKSLKVEEQEAYLRRKIVLIGKDIFGKYYIPYRKVTAKDGYAEISMIEQAEKLYNIIMERGDCLSVTDMAINGNDIRNLGVSEGRMIGNMLNSLFEEVLRDERKNSREWLMAAAEEMCKNNI